MNTITISSITLFSLLLILNVAVAQRRSMNMVGEYEQGVINVSTTSINNSESNKYLYKKSIAFTKQFNEIPEVLLTIQGIALIRGSNNSYQIEIQSITRSSFDIIVQSYDKESEFNIILCFIAFQNSALLQVHYFFNLPTPTLASYQLESKQKVFEKVGSIELSDKISQVDFGASVFILGVKSSDNTQDVSISGSVQILEKENKVDVIASTWNFIRIESISFVVLVWNLPSWYQGEWKGFQFDYTMNQYKQHPWTNPISNSRFTTLSCESKLSEKSKLSFLKIYGIKGYDIREGPLVIVEKDIKFDLENNLSSSTVGTMGKTKLVGAWINVLLLADVDQSLLEEQMSSLTICFIVAGSLIGIFIVCSLIYLKFGVQDHGFKHKKFSNKEYGNQSDQTNGQASCLNSMSSQSSNGLYSPNQQKDVVTLEFPQKAQKSNQRKKNQFVLLSKDLLTGVKQSEKSARQYEQKTIIVEMSEECSNRNKFNEKLNFQSFQQALEKQGSLDIEKKGSLNGEKNSQKIEEKLMKKYQIDNQHRESLSEIESTQENEHSNDDNNHSQKQSDQQSKAQFIDHEIEINPNQPTNLVQNESNVVTFR